MGWGDVYQGLKSLSTVVRPYGAGRCGKDSRKRECEKGFSHQGRPTRGSAATVRSWSFALWGLAISFYAVIRVYSHRVCFQPVRARMTAASSGNSGFWDFVSASGAVTKSAEFDSSRSISSRSIAWAQISLRNFCSNFGVETRGSFIFLCHFGTATDGLRSLTPYTRKAASSR